MSGKKAENEVRCCGGCCWFRFEDTGGNGLCCHVEDILSCPVNCSDLCTNDKYVSIEQMRHYRAVLLQLNRYRRDQHVPSIYKMPDVTEIGKAIDFASEYIRVFSEM